MISAAWKLSSCFPQFEEMKWRCGLLSILEKDNLVTGENCVKFEEWWCHTLICLETFDEPSGYRDRDVQYDLEKVVNNDRING